jgi:hypothetical protein
MIHFTSIFFSVSVSDFFYITFLSSLFISASQFLSISVRIPESPLFWSINDLIQNMVDTRTIPPTNKFFAALALLGIQMKRAASSQQFSEL